MDIFDNELQTPADLNGKKAGQVNNQSAEAENEVYLFLLIKVVYVPQTTSTRFFKKCKKILRQRMRH